MHSFFLENLVSWKVLLVPILQQDQKLAIWMCRKTIRSYTQAVWHDLTRFPDLCSPEKLRQERVVKARLARANSVSSVTATKVDLTPRPPSIGPTSDSLLSTKTDISTADSKVCWSVSCQLFLWTQWQRDVLKESSCFWQSKDKVVPTAPGFMGAFNNL